MPFHITTFFIHYLSQDQTPISTITVLLDLLTRCQQEKIRDPIIDMDNRFNEVFPSFNPHNSEFSPSSKIIDTFSSHFSFHFFNKCGNDSLVSCMYQLNNLAIVFSEDSLSTLIVMDTSIKCDVAMSIAHIHICNKHVVKTLYHTVNIASMEAKLFTMRCGMN